MFHVNTFSLYDLAGAIILLPLAVWFFISFVRFGRRRADLLFAGLTSCASVICLLGFLMDNVVCCGTPAHDVPGAAAKTLVLARLAYTLGLLGMPMQIPSKLCDISQWPIVMN